jgi:hypothetical protein
VLVAGVAVAQVVPELDGLRHRVAEADQACDDLLECVRPAGQEGRHHALEHAEFDRGVPLDREIAARNLSHNLGQLGQQRALVMRLEALLRVEADVGNHRCQRRGQADLEPNAMGDDALIAQAPDDGVRGVRRGGVTEGR